VWLERSKSRTYVVQMLTFGLVSPLISPHFRHADVLTRESISMSVSDAGLSIIFQKYRPLLTMVIMSEKRENWNHFVSRDIIPMVLVDILEENGNEMKKKSQMKSTLLMIMTRTRTMSTMTINHHHVFYIWI